MVLTGAGAAPPLPPGSRFRTLGSKCAAHSRFHLPPNQRCRGEQKQDHWGVPYRLTITIHTLPVSSWLGPIFPNCARLPVYHAKQCTASPVMLADSHAQAFSVANPTAMLSALLRTWEQRTGVRSQGQRQLPESPSSSMQMHIYTYARMHTYTHHGPAGSRPLPYYIQLLGSPLEAVPVQLRGSSFGRTSKETGGGCEACALPTPTPPHPTPNAGGRRRPHIPSHP